MIRNWTHWLLQTWRTLCPSCPPADLSGSRTQSESLGCWKPKMANISPQQDALSEQKKCANVQYLHPFCRYRFLPPAKTQHVKMLNCKLLNCWLHCTLFGSRNETGVVHTYHENISSTQNQGNRLCLDVCRQPGMYLKIDFSQSTFLPNFTRVGW